MSIVTSALLALTVIFVLATRQSNAIVQCLSCPPASVNLTSDAKLNTTGCTLVNGDLCVLSVQIDYSHPDQNAANFNAVNTPILVFSNDQPQLTSNAVIWFDQVRMQRVATVQCLAGTSCGVDLLQKQYSEQIRPFDYVKLWSQLSELLYSATVASGNLKCVDSFNESVACPNGSCYSATDGNMLRVLSSCMPAGPAVNPYGLTITRASMPNLVEEQTMIMYACNKPMCNSKETVLQVLQLLAAAELIPMLPTTTTTTTITTTTKASGNMLNSDRNLLVFSFVFIFMIMYLNDV